MQRFASAIAGLFVCALGACVGPDGGGFTRAGIGTDLYSPDILQATELLEVYSGSICRQASLPLVEVGSGLVSCDYASMAAGEWNAFVQMGIYDIDRRCDAYLAWLDERRRTREAVIQQISDTRTFVQTILTVGGVSAVPITIVANALGYASDAYGNITSRLLYSLDLTAVQALISKRQQQRKQEVASLDFTAKPAALNALRLYLRTCLPHTIEARVNESVTAQAYGVSLTRANDPDRIDPSTTGARPLTARTPVRQTQRPPPLTDPSYAAIIENYNPAVHGRGWIVEIQRALCARPESRAPLAPARQH